MLKKRNRGQVGTEYMIIVGFVTLAITTILVLSLFYSNQIKDKIKNNNIESFATQLVSSAETVFFSGEPSKTTIKLYLPEGVEAIDIYVDMVVVTSRTSGGSLNIRAFQSKVPLNGTLSNLEGLKKIVIEAKATHAQIN
jgi:hypothetical protein